MCEISGGLEMVNFLNNILDAILYIFGSGIILIPGLFI